MSYLVHTLLLRAGVLEVQESCSGRGRERATVRPPSTLKKTKTKALFYSEQGNRIYFPFLYILHRSSSFNTMGTFLILCHACGIILRRLCHLFLMNSTYKVNHYTKAGRRKSWILNLLVSRQRGFYYMNSCSVLLRSRFCVESRHRVGRTLLTLPLPLLLSRPALTPHAPIKTNAGTTPWRDSSREEVDEAGGLAPRRQAMGFSCSSLFWGFSFMCVWFRGFLHASPPFSFPMLVC